MTVMAAPFVAWPAGMFSSASARQARRLTREQSVIAGNLYLVLGPLVALDAGALVAEVNQLISDGLFQFNAGSLEQLRAWEAARDKAELEQPGISGAGAAWSAVDLK